MIIGDLIREMIIERVVMRRAFRIIAMAVYLIKRNGSVGVSVGFNKLHQR